MIKGADTDAAMKAIANLFADTSPESVSNERVAAELKKHGISRDELAFGLLSTDYSRVVQGTYEHALRAFLQDLEISDEEAEYLRQLASSLGLSEGQRADSLRALVTPHFAEAVRKVIEDGEISLDDANELKSLGARLALPETDQDNIRREIVAPVATKEFNKMIADRRLTESEYSAWLLLCKKLRINPEHSEKTRLDLERFKLLARIDAGDLPEVTCSVSLQKSEVCHFVTGASWAEVRTSTKRIDYGAVSGRVKVMKGVYFRLGSVAPKRISEEALTTLDEGEMLITSKRVIFCGSKGSKSVTLKSLLGFEVFSDGLRLEKPNGKPPYLLFSGDIELAAAILSRKLSDQRD